MIENIKKYQIGRFLLALALIISGGILIWRSLRQTTLVLVDGEIIEVRSSSPTVPGVLRSAGMDVDPSDRVRPSTEGFVWDLPVIHIEKPRKIRLISPDQELTVLSTENIPANILMDQGIRLYPQDQLLINGEIIDPEEPIINSGDLLMQYLPAKVIRLKIGDMARTLYTDQVTVGAALEAAAIYPGPEDWVSEDLMAPVSDGMAVAIRRARPVTVKVGENVITGFSQALTVGEALLELGLPLQNLDYSLPAVEEPVPASGEIEVVRVREEVIIATDEVGFENEYVADPETPLDEYSVIEPGQVGIHAARERVQYVNGVEVNRRIDDRWKASDPKDGLMGYGTKVVIRTEVVDGVTIEYWRKKYVYATSYEPCDNQGVCHDGTAGGYPLQMGIVAVTPQWYSVPNGLAMADLPVYVPGYGRGIIGDVGGGIPGTPWIDLAYRPEDDFTWDAHWLTMYFLTPVPDIIPPIITP